MGFYTGRTGHLVFNGKRVAKIRDWSLTTTVELLSTNTIDSIANTFTAGVKGASGSATMLYYRLESGESTTYTQFTALLGKIMKKGAIEDSTDRLRLELNVGSNAADDVSFDCFITSATVGASTGELSAVPFEFTVHGDFVDVIV